MRISVQAIWNRGRAEFSQSPFQFIMSTIGVLAVLATAFLPTLQMLFPASALAGADIGLFSKIAGGLLMQGVLSTLVGRLQVVLAKMGDGFPVVLIILGSALAGWVTTLTAHTVAMSGVETLEAAVFTFAASVIVGVILYCYLLGYQFDTYEKMKLTSIGLSPSEYTFPPIKKFYWWSVLSFAVAVLIFGAHFSLRIAEAFKSRGLLIVGE